jgi:hypothetical protein
MRAPRYRYRSMDKRPRHYPSGTSDEQWAIIELLPAVRAGGRPEKHSRRAIVDAISDGGFARRLLEWASQILRTTIPSDRGGPRGEELGRDPATVTDVSPGVRIGDSRTAAGLRIGQVLIAGVGA